MTPEQFVYWLQGFAEIYQAEPDAAEWQTIKDHLALVFKKETPKREKSELEKYLDANPPKDSGLKTPWSTPPAVYPLQVTC